MSKKQKYRKKKGELSYKWLYKDLSNAYVQDRGVFARRSNDLLTALAAGFEQMITRGAPQNEPDIEPWLRALDLMANVLHKHLTFDELDVLMSREAQDAEFQRMFGLDGNRPMVIDVDTKSDQYDLHYPYPQGDSAVTQRFITGEAPLGGIEQFQDEDR
jgi:hypothetical protein